jgi:tetratricopeptide (TPR) repeat protein
VPVPSGPRGRAPQVTFTDRSEDASAVPSALESAIAKATLPPPEWTAPVGESTRKRNSTAPPPAPQRRQGERAEEATLRAELAEARAGTDVAQEKRASVALARWLAARDRDLDEAAQLALRSLRIEDDAELRRDLSKWLESLGEAGLAAAVLRAVVDEEAPSTSEGVPAAVSIMANTLLRVGVLHARAGDPVGASDAFDDAAGLGEGTLSADQYKAGALGLELKGTLASWAPEIVSPAVAAEAYVEAAARRSKAGDDPMEDLLRGFEADPGSEPAARALAAALHDRGKVGAGDEILREHARALMPSMPERARSIHAERRQEAVQAGDVARALGAAFDEGLDAQHGGEAGALALDELLLRAGLLEMLAARIEARAELDPAGRVRHFEALARLCAGPLADPDRAAVAYAELYILDETSQEAEEAVRSYAVRKGAGPVLEALADGNAAALRTAVLEARWAFGLDPGPVEPVLELALATRVRGDAVAANELTREVLGSVTTTRRAASLAWVNAVLCKDVATAALALERLAMDTSPAIRAVLHAVAAERLLSMGDAAGARPFAERACQADPTAPRSVVMMAEACMTGDDRMSASVLERAVKVVCARGRFCERLASVLEKLEETSYAIAWTQQYVALRPGDRAATQLLVDRVVRARDAGRLGDALAWVLSQPQPAGPLADLVGQGLRELAQLDADRAVVVARRALDVFGPRKPQLRAALLDAAERAGDDDLSGAVIERWIASGATAEERRELFVALAERRRILGDREGEARALTRALRLGASVTPLSERIFALAEANLAGDAGLAWLEARALLLAEGEDPGAAAIGFRELGAGLWDLAGDRYGAVEAWLRAAKLAPDRGYHTLATDLAQFADDNFAFSCLESLVDKEEDRNQSGLIAAEAARAAIAIGHPGRAFELASLALERSPEHAEALEIAESGALNAGRVREMSELYDRVGERALGRFGRRAAHYRGARFFEQHGEARLALKHAGHAFIAVPSEGAALVLLQRVAQRAGDRGMAVRTLEQVAELSRSLHARSGWLLRAAELAGKDEDGLRQKVDCLLRAALLMPDVGTLSLLTDAASELVKLAPAEADALALRVANASRMLTAKIEGPDGARTALALAQLTVRLFEDGEGALHAITRALNTDADIDEYARLVPHAGILAAAPGAESFIAGAQELMARPYSNVGAGALKLLAAMVHMRGDEHLRDRLTVRAAVREPEDSLLVRAADEAALRLGDADLTKMLDKAISADERGEVFRQHARELATGGQHDQAIHAMERAIQLLAGEERASAEAEILTFYSAAGRPGDLEQRAMLQAEDTSLPARDRADRYAEIAQWREERGDVASTVGLLFTAAELDPEPLVRWSALERAAELTKMADVRVLALQAIEKRVEKEARPAVLRRLARALDDAGDIELAIDVLEEVLEIVPDDEESEHTVEAMIVAAGDYTRLAAHLAGRITRLLPRMDRRDSLRAVRLRRAAILEQRLGRVEEACTELEELLREWPENESALRYLADLYERTGQTHRAAPLWKYLSALSPRADTANELELRAVAAMREAGDLRGALSLATAMQERDQPSLEAMALRVELARELNDDAELGAALESAANFGGVDDSTAADMWVDAAQAAARIGDTAKSLERARRAAGLAPERAATQLFARGLEYRLRGAGSKEEAERTVEELDKIEGDLEPEDVALATFLAVEALAILERNEEAASRLTEACELVGQQPLLALASAERAVKDSDHRKALGLFQVALEGNLLGFRSRGSVALLGAEAAMRCERPDTALSLLEEATQHPESRDPALRQIAQLASAAGDVARARIALREVVRGARGEPRALALAQLGRLLFSAPVTAQAGEEVAEAEAEQAFAEAISLAPEGSVLAAQLTAELSTLRQRRTSLRPPESVDSRVDSPRGSNPRIAPVELLPNAVERLLALQREASADSNTLRERAIEHLLRALDPRAAPLPPPPLSAQSLQPGVLGLITRTLHPAIHDVLSLLWEGAQEVFLRDLKVPPPGSPVKIDGGGPLSRHLEAATRLLDLPKVHLHARHSEGHPAANVLLGSPPIALLSGDLREDTAELRFSLGVALANTLPQNILLAVLNEEAGLMMWRAALGAFGPPEYGRQLDARSGRMAESFWHAVPPKTQRRIQELLQGAPRTSYAAALSAVQTSARRLGLFFAGDFAFVARHFLETRGVELTEALTTEGIDGVLGRHAELLDLARLAISTEYADARWHPVPTSPEPSSPGTSGRYRRVSLLG